MRRVAYPFLGLSVLVALGLLTSGASAGDYYGDGYYGRPYYRSSYYDYGRPYYRGGY